MQFENGGLARRVEKNVFLLAATNHYSINLVAPDALTLRLTPGTGLLSGRLTPDGPQDRELALAALMVARSTEADEDTLLALQGAIERLRGMDQPGAPPFTDSISRTR